MRTPPTRLRVGVASLTALLVFIVAALTAGPAAAGNATPAFDPQTTNIPYLAWRGQEVDLVKCFEGGKQQVIDFENALGSFQIMDWSGDPHQRPQFLNTFAGGVFADFGQGEQEGDICFRADIGSSKAGLAMVKLAVSNFPGGPVVAKHEFLVAWMNLNPTSLRDIVGNTTVQAGTEAGLNQFGVNLTGNFPLGGNFSELGLGTSLTMPNDWAALAGALARSSNPDDDRNPLLWDIHDDQLATEGHRGNVCSDGSDIDAVDNCTGGDEFGPFSNIWGLAGDAGFGGVIGPFDPLRPDQTLLSDGKIDAGDAPMPSAPVRFSITPNTGGATDISGVGFLVPVDKHFIYSRSGSGGGAHDLYAPFYATYLPATSAPQTSSGVSGPAMGNNFPGFLHNGGQGGLYHYWDFARVHSEAVAMETGCLRIGDEFRLTPSGPQSVTVYSDEHGEARGAFAPGLGFFFDNLGAIVNANGGCDLQGINPLGTAQITATIDYPYQTITLPAPDVTGVVNKVVTSAFNKQITCVPKGPGLANSLAFICTVVAVDIDGTPFAGEVVCFSGTFETIFPFPQGTPTVADPRGALPPRLCLVLNASGQAQVEVFGKDAFNVIVDFTEQQILRFISLGGPATQPGTGTNPAPPPATGTGGTGGTGGAGAGQGGTSTVISLGGNVKPTKATAGKRLTVARIVYKKNARVLMVRVNSTAKTARVRVVMRAGRKVVATAVRTVRTNRLTQVPNLKVSKRITKVTVSAI
jgi:hypothetical protein